MRSPPPILLLRDLRSKYLKIKLLLTGLLPKREFDREWVLEVLGYRQRRNHAAYLSHRKRRLDMLSQLE